MNNPVDPYRTSDFNAKAYCDEQIRELLDKRLESFQEEIRVDVKKLLKEPRQVGDNVLYMNVWKYVSLVAVVVIVAALAGVLHGHGTDVQIAHEATQLEHEKSMRISHEEAKAMWDHLNGTVAAADAGAK